MGKVQSQKQINKSAVQTTRQLGKPREYHFLGLKLKKFGLFIFISIFLITLYLIWVLTHNIVLTVTGDESLALSAAVIALILLFDELLVIMVFIITLSIILKRRKKRKRRQQQQRKK